MKRNFDYHGAGERIAEIRRSHDLTQPQLADMLGVGSSHISHIENGNGCFSMDTAIHFCELFECSLDEIYFGQTHSKVLNLLPERIKKILSGNNVRQKDHLLEYLNFYINFPR